MQVCLDKPLHFFVVAFMFLLLKSSYFFAPLLFKAVCESFWLVQIKVLYLYCLTERISHVWAPPWIVSEEAQLFVFVWRGIVAKKLVNQNEDSDGATINFWQFKACVICKICLKSLYFQSFSRKKVKFEFKKILVTWRGGEEI